VCNLKAKKNRLAKRDESFKASVNEVCARLQLLLEESVQKNLTENMLFSGGVDPRARPFVEMKMTDVSITHDARKTEK
jgi:hypothetical protein